MKTLKLKVLFATIFLASIAFGATIAERQDIPDTIMLTETNHVLLRGEVTEESVSKALSDFSHILNKRKHGTPIYLVLDTPGGSVGDGYRLYEFLKTYENVHTITLNSYSMGAVLVELLPGKRLMVETGTLMFHRMKASLPGFNTPEQLHSRVNYYSSMEQFAMDKIVERVGIDRKDLEKSLDEELYLNGKRAVERKFADKVVSVRCSDSLLKKKNVEVIQPMPFLPPMEIEVSACPLL